MVTPSKYSSPSIITFNGNTLISYFFKNSLFTKQEVSEIASAINEELVKLEENNLQKAIDVQEDLNEILEISKELELEYFNKFVNKEVEFLPEIYKDGYIIGHTDNYLLVKTKGNVENLNELTKVKLEKVEYPYIIGK